METFLNCFFYNGQFIYLQNKIKHEYQNLQEITTLIIPIIISQNENFFANDDK